MCIYSCSVIGQGAKDEMIVEFTKIVTGFNLYFYFIYPQITSYFFVHLHVVIDMMMLFITQLICRARPETRDPISGPVI